MVEHKCGTCHSVEVAIGKKRDKEDWKKVIHGMKIRGLKITEKEEQAILSYLIEYHGE
ncbi:MAG: hypothetical protein N3C60_05580 [Calditerrivibrio sp.]|nr:hypothetical protein [Calditerrivibrio sp.]